MRWVQGCVAVLLAGVVSGSGMLCPAQIIKRPKPVPEKSACSYITKAEAEAVVGATLEPGVADAKARSCRYLEPGYGLEPGKPKKQVSIALSRSYFQNASDVSIRWQAIEDDHTLSPMVVHELQNFGDAALWVWAGGYYGILYAFKDGSSEVAVRISGIEEQAALAAAKKFAARALGGSGTTGYKYAPPEMTMAQSYYMPDILRPLYEGEFERVRDDEQARRYVVALMQGLNASCPKMPEELPVMVFGFHSAWKRDKVALKADAEKDYDAAYAAQMERLKKSSPEILREGNADAQLFVKENGEKSGCMTAPVQHLYQQIVNLATERQRVLPTDWR
jgi:hypothetical protein